MREVSFKRRVRRLLSRSLRPWQAWLRKRCLLCVDRLTLLAPAHPDRNRVLFLRFDNIGDFVVWLDAAQALAEHYHRQGKHVTLLANAVWKDWAAELGIFDEVRGVQEQRFRRDLRYRCAVGREIRKLGFGTVVQPAYTRILEGGDSLVRLSGAPVRVGPVGVFEQEATQDRKIADPWYTQLFRLDPSLSAEMQRNAAFVRALTGSRYQAAVADLRAYADLRLSDSLAQELQDRPYFVLFPGATFAGRLWPVERYGEIARRLSQKTGWLGVVCGGPGEARQAASLCAETDVPLLNWVGRTSLMQLGAVLAGAQLLVANETSAVHIAAATGTRAVCVLGGGHFGRFMPYSIDVTDGRPLPVAVAEKMLCFHCDWRCIYHPPKGAAVPCIEGVSVEALWAAVQKALAGASDTGDVVLLPPQIASVPRDNIPRDDVPRDNGVAAFC